MQYRQLGSSGIHVSVVGMGTMSWPNCRFGVASESPSAADFSQVEAMVRTALDSGVTLIDTAEGYGCGVAEELLGQTLERLGRRDEAVLVTKVGPLFGGEKVNGRGCDLSAARIIACCEGSLRRLRTECIDVYLAHWPDEATPIGETMQAAETLRAQGKIRAFGVSNFGKTLLQETLKSGPVAANQMPYSLVDRGLEAENLPFCLENAIGIIAYSPLGKGVLSGKYQATHLPPADDYRHQRQHFAPENLSRYFALAERLRVLGAELFCSPAQLALAWVLARPGVTVIIPGAKTVEQVRHNAAAGDVIVPPEILAELDRLSL